MLFCEKCNFIMIENRCPLCGSKKIRPVHDADFCFYVNLDEFHFNVLESALSEKDIEIIGVPYYPRSVTYATAGRAQGRKVYIRYHDIERVREIYETLFGSVN